ncbi:MAG: cyanophycin synthetase [Bacteroidetes bacterium]|nr:cyanophycin synthetase [Bacteroidota bacterium]HET6243257.1 cyanophycin synthetase [Bacteroidia bacterium]
MKVISTKVMRGPNYWSISNENLIVSKLDLETIHSHTNKIKDFERKMAKILVSKANEKDFEFENDFLRSLKSGTTIPNVVEYLARELQRLVGLPSDYGRVYTTSKKNVFNIVVAYTVENVGIEAVLSAVDICSAVINDEEFDINKEIKFLKALKRKYAPSMSTEAILKEADIRGIPYTKGFYSRETVFGYGVNQKKINGVLTSSTSFMGVDVTGDKDLTKMVLEKAKIPVSFGVIIEFEDEVDYAINKVGFPIVVKPLDGNHGKGISLNLNTKNQVIDAYHIAKEVAQDIIVEKFIKGFDYRLLVINYKFSAATKRIAASITGDGLSTIKELISDVNSDPARAVNEGNVLTPIQIDEVTMNILKKKGLTLQSVLKRGEIVYVKEIANVSAGAVPYDVTDEIHPHNRFLAERIARIVGLDICGIDLISPDLSVPFYQNNTAILEVNASPGIKMHLMPSMGKSRNVVGAIMDMMFPSEKQFKIPIAAITGTNGKTTVTRMIAHLVKVAGYNVGYTTTEGIYINDVIISKGDCSGPASSQLILTDPNVEFAVLECARGGILRSGLAFNNCDVGVVTNITEDHLGVDDIETLEDLAQVKAVVARTVVSTGYAVLNADDDLVFEMAENLNCKVALFSMDPESKRIKDHVSKNGVAAVVENGVIVVYNGDLKMQIEEVNDIPATFGGKAEFMVQNTLPVVLFGYVSGFDTDIIKNALMSFYPSPDKTPGRMNFFKFNEFEVLVDYAHNPAGIDAIGKFVNNYTGVFKTGIIAAPGDRPDAQIISIGEKTAHIFDEIIIRSDKNLRGRQEKEIHDLLLEGIRKSKKKVPVRIISSESEAIKYAVENARKKQLITVFTESIDDSIQTLKQLQEKELVGEYEL